jgi:hypothetical protein
VCGGAFIVRRRTIGKEVRFLSGSINDLAGYISKQKERYDVTFAFALPALG